MDTNDIRNRVDNAENDREMAEAVDSVVDELAVGLLALAHACLENPYVDFDQTRLPGMLVDRVQFLMASGFKP
jgi:hypothetical protein